MNLRYYNYDIHKAAFVLPEFAKMVSAYYRNTTTARRKLIASQLTAKNA